MTRRGYQVKVFLPDEISNLKNLESTDAILDISTLNFTDRKFGVGIFKRENYSCFYCFSKITNENGELDHVVPQSEAVDNSFRNIVATCHSCNRKKGNMEARLFILSLYRQGLITQEELAVIGEKLINLQAGNLKPDL